jgi:hypothetical protein
MTPVPAAVGRNINDVVVVRRFAVDWELEGQVIEDQLGAIGAQLEEMGAYL